MDQKENLGGTARVQGQQTTQNPNRDQAEGERQPMPGRDEPGQKWSQGQQPSRQQNQPEPRPGQTRDDTPPKTGTQEVGTGRPGERNQGISNRGMQRELDEQEELPERGSDQSER